MASLSHCNNFESSKTVSCDRSNAISVDDVESVDNWWIDDFNVMHRDREAVVSGNWLSHACMAHKSVDNIAL